eukprot:03241.XXX_64377_66211_1 [CDS] Oithona nana genome sequencing.
MNWRFHFFNFCFVFLLIFRSSLGQKTQKQRNRPKEPTGRSNRNRPQLDCKKDFDCYNGQYCSKDLGKCFDLGDAGYNDPCKRNGDCLKNLKCIAGSCSTMGQEGDFCSAPEHCRANMFCNTKSESCLPKLLPGEVCEKNLECFQSLCLEPQRQPQHQPRGPYQPRRSLKFCAMIGAEKTEACDPKSYHCNIGLVCKRRSKGGPRGPGRLPGRPGRQGGRPGRQGGRPGRQGRRPGRPGRRARGSRRPGPGRPRSDGRRGRRGRRGRGQGRAKFANLKAIKAADEPEVIETLDLSRKKRQADYADYSYEDIEYGGGIDDEKDDYGNEYPNDDQYEDYPDYPSEDDNPVLALLPPEGQLRNEIERRLKRFSCQLLSPMGTGDSCQSSLECRCGEFCSRRGFCLPATCDLASPGVCATYPGLNHKFHCRNGLCMPPTSDFNLAFQSSATTPSSNLTTTTPRFG